jgi:hypothetical protein
LYGDNLPTAVAGLHVKLLEQAGRQDDAKRLTQIAIVSGADLAVRAGSFLGAEPGLAAAEYESLFAKGLINSRMIHEYLKALAKLGRWEEHARILAPEQLFQVADVPKELCDAVDAMVLELGAKANQLEASQSVRNMWKVSGLEQSDHQTARILIGELESRTAVYLKQWRASSHPFAHLVPSHLEIGAWGLVSRGEGYNIPHIHGRGWASGVFYPRSIKGAGGELVIGPPEDSAGTGPHWVSRSVKPKAGRLVLFPSFYTHWTVPLARPGLRTSVAFDVEPKLQMLSQSCAPGAS